MAYFICEKQGRCCSHEFYNSIEQAITDSEDGVPCDHLIEVAPVVRCKNCRYFGLNDENVPYCLNPFGLDDPEPNGFCNYGIGKN